MLDPDVLSWHADPETATPEFLLALLEIRRIIEPKAAELVAASTCRGVNSHQSRFVSW